MSRTLYAYLYSNGRVYKGEMRITFECDRPRGVKISENITFEELKDLVKSKLKLSSHQAVSQLYYRVPISSVPLLYGSYCLEDDTDVELMITTHSQNQSQLNFMELYVEISNVEIDLNVGVQSLPSLDTMGHGHMYLPDEPHTSLPLVELYSSNEQATPIENFTCIEPGPSQPPFDTFSPLPRENLDDFTDAEPGVGDDDDNDGDDENLGTFGVDDEDDDNDNENEQDDFIQAQPINEFEDAATTFYRRVNI